MKDLQIIIFLAFILGLCCGNQSRGSLIEGSYKNYSPYMKHYKKMYHNNFLPGTINCAIDKCGIDHKQNCRVRHKWSPYLSKCF